MTHDVTDVQNLLDRQAISDVLSTYAASIDERDMARYRALFRDDVEVVGFAEEPLVGADAWREFVDAQLARFRSTQHMLGPQLTDVRGDEAEARTDLQATHLMQEPRGEIFVLWATYQTRLVRDASAEHGWRIVRHELVVRASQTTQT
jgi:3-phenylpropionate/cinnamic acid dioxygenase small subunit